MRAVRDDEVAAQLAGLDVARTQVTAFVVSAACAGLAGGALAVVTQLAAPGAFTLVLSLSLLTGIVLGGLGSLPGALWGAIALVMLPSWSDDIANSFSLSTDVQSNLPLALYGVVLMGVIVAAPEGIQGAVRRLGRRSAPAPRPCLTRRLHDHFDDRRPGLGLAGCLAAAAVLAARLWQQRRLEPRRRRPGITKTSVKIGGHTPLTGPAAPGYSEIAPAAKAFFAYVNAQGGVNGRKINYIYRDDGYNPTKTVSVVRQLVLQDKVFAIFNGLGTPTHTKVVDYLNTSKVPDLFVASGCPCWDDAASHPYTFGWQTELPDRGQDPRRLHQEALRRQEGRRLLPGRRLRPGRADRAQGGDPQPDRGAPSPTSRATPTWPPRSRRSRRRTRHPGRLHDPGVHRAGPARLVQGRLQAAAVHLERRRRPDDGRRAAEVVLEGQGEHGADRGRLHRRLPAVRQPTRRTRGSRCSRRSTTSTTPRRRSTATSSTAWRRRTRSPRR